MSFMSAEFESITATVNGRLEKIFRQILSIELFHDGGSYHMVTNPLICMANQWTGFYMIRTFVMEELNKDEEDVCQIG